jgi:hypothetical protein
MEKCPNHPDKNAVYTCHYCGEHFCELCLIESGDFYYCKNPNCREQVKNSILSGLPEEIVCPNYSENLELEERDRISRQVH